MPEYMSFMCIVYIIYGCCRVCNQNWDSDDMRSREVCQWASERGKDTDLGHSDTAPGQFVNFVPCVWCYVSLSPLEWHKRKGQNKRAKKPDTDTDTDVGEELTAGQ